MTDIRVNSEPTVYGPYSPYSYLWDIWAATMRTGIGWHEAAARLKRYEAEQEHWDSAQRARRERVLRDGRPTSGDELRAPMSPAVGFGGELVPPVFLMDMVAAYRPSICSFETQCTHMQLPPYGVAVQVPNFTTGVQFAAQTANTGVVESDPATGFLKGGSLPFFTLNVHLIAGQFTVSQQLFERGGMQGFTFDQMLMKGAVPTLVDQVDTQVLTEVLAKITQSPVTDSSAYSVSGFYTDVAQAKQDIATLNGTRYRPTHLFMPSNQVDKLEEQVDDDHRPIFAPDWATMSNKDDGDTGYNVQSLRIWRDDNIPASSSNSQLLVSRPDTVLVFDGEITPFVYTQTWANDLSVVVNLRKYMATVSLYPNGTQVITGSAYPTSASA